MGFKCRVSWHRVMESSITPQRIANAILQDKSHKGYYLLVEGKKDIPIYRKFVSSELVKIKPTFGKHQMRLAYELLNRRDFEKKFGIRDADFIRIRGKYQDNYESKLFITDCHDSEGMIISKESLYDFLHSVSNGNKIRAFEEAYSNIRELIYGLAYPIGCLRLANKNKNLGLSFKPKKPEGNRFKISNIISDKTFSYKGHLSLIDTIYNYSTNRGNELAKKEEILNSLLETIRMGFDKENIVNGHDLSQILLIICKKGLKSRSKLLADSDCVESLLSLSFSLPHFTQTGLYDLLTEYQNEIKQPILVA